MKASVKGSDIFFGEKKIKIGELFSPKTINFANEHASDFYYDTCIVNELFGSYVIPRYNLYKFVCENNIEEIDITYANSELSALVQDVSLVINVEVRGKSKRLSKSSVIVNRFLSFLYLLFQQLRQKYKPAVQNNEAIVFIRSKATALKFNKIDWLDKFYETKPGVGTLYEQFTLFERISILFAVTRIETNYFRELSAAMKYFNMPACTSVAKEYYSKRFLHTAFYSRLVDSVIENTNYKVMYTGNNLDRFAFNEEKTASKKGLQLKVIPHGIEYGYRFPKCFVGDVFYTCSKYAAVFLNNLYDTDKFTFSKDIGNRMFKVNVEKHTHIKVVYFTEPRRAYVNVEILRALYPLLKSEGVDLFIKLHPLETVNTYQDLIGMGVKEIKDFKESISENICIARKSTTLLEAAYNNSKSIAILVDDGDKTIFETFPSLQDDNIVCFFDIKEAAQYINSIYKEMIEKEAKYEKIKY